MDGERDGDGDGGFARTLSGVIQEAGARLGIRKNLA